MRNASLGTASYFRFFCATVTGIKTAYEFTLENCPTSFPFLIQRKFDKYLSIQSAPVPLPGKGGARKVNETAPSKNGEKGGGSYLGKEVGTRNGTLPLLALYSPTPSKHSKAISVLSAGAKKGGVAFGKVSWNLAARESRRDKLVKKTTNKIWPNMYGPEFGVI